MDTGELAAIGEAENAFVQLKRNVHVHPVFRLIGTEEELFCSGEPNELAVEAEVEREEATVEMQVQVFSPAFDSLNLLPFCEIRKLGGLLRPRRYGVKDVDATNPPVHDERPQRARDGFYLREFGHSS